MRWQRHLLSIGTLPRNSLYIPTTPTNPSQIKNSFSSNRVLASPAIHTPKETTQYEVDHLVIGAGVVGLAVAERLAARGAGSTLLVDKNSGAGQETSSRNSEVIHAGLYYPVDSLKTKLCIRGNELMYDFCEKYNVEHQQITKWVVGKSDADVEYLEALSKKAHALLLPTKRMPGPPTYMLTQDQMLSQEPHVKGKIALVSPRTGIVDAHGLMQTLEARIQDHGGMIAFQCEVVGLERPQSGTGGSFKVTMTSPEGPVVVKAGTVINSAGLHADRVYNLLQMGSLSSNLSASSMHLHYSKGHYYSYSGPALTSRLIYPVPDKNLASLGTHLTLDLVGRMRFGPDVHPIDRLDDYSIDPSTVGSPASLELIGKVVGDYLDLVDPSLLYADYAGIRPKLAGPGEPFRDFIIHHHNGFVNLAGIESPGLTSSLAIAEHVEAMLY
ncbi:FAD dependent oxidoreductase [Mortierella sp. GBAus27b]|nr:FAD dependent oxidoreductase [Mortierella sp. GBAus27b]